MGYIIKLSQFPNQEFYTISNGHRYVFTLHLFKGILYADIAIDEDVICNGVRCIMNEWIIPYRFRTRGYGNFKFVGEYGKYPDYNDFPEQCYIKCYDNDEYLKELHEYGE